MTTAGARNGQVDQDEHAEGETGDDKEELKMKINIPLQLR